MIRPAIISLTLLLFGSVLLAQTEKVRLKNGSVIRGEVLRLTSEALDIRLDGQSQLSVPLSAVKEIGINRRKTTLDTNMLSLLDSLNGYAFKPRFYHQLRFGMMIGQESFFLREWSGLSVDYTFFRQFNRTMSLGVGMAFDSYTSFQTVPFYLEARKELGNMLSHPFVYVNGGYSLARGREALGQVPGPVSGGSMWGFGFGLAWPMGKNSLQMSLGFKRQQLQSRWDGGDFRWFTDWNLRRVEWKLGFSF